MTVGGRIFAAIAVLFWAILPGFGLIDLSTMFVEDSYYAEVAALETSWGVLTTFAVALPFGWAACRPRGIWPVLALLWLTTAALLLGALLGFSFGPVVMAAVLGVMSLGLLWSARRAGSRFQRPRLSVDWPLLVLAVLALPFWAAYAWYALEVSRTTGSQPEYWTMGIDHWPVQGALGIVLAGTCLLHALWPQARSLLRTVLSFSYVSLGISWLLGPDTGGSVDNTWLAIAAVLWGVLTALRSPALPSEPGAASEPGADSLRVRKFAPGPDSHRGLKLHRRPTYGAGSESAPRTHLRSSRIKKAVPLLKKPVPPAGRDVRKEGPPSCSVLRQRTLA